MYREQSNDLQQTLSHLIDRKLHNATLTLQRTFSSVDADGHPGELYGVDGELFYRKHGGVGQELGTGGGSGLWESPGAVTKLINNERVDLYDDLHFVGYQFLSWEYGGLALGQIYGFHGATWQDFMIESKNSGVLTLLSAAGYIDFSGSKLSSLGAPASANDAVRVDSSLHVPLGNMALTSKGTVFAGNGATCGVLAAGTNAHVLTLDSTAALGVKWAAGSGGTLDHAALTSNMAFATCGHTGFMGNPAAANLAMADKTLTAVGGITMNDATSDIAMAGSKITGLADGTANDHAATVGQLGGLWDSNTSDAWLTSSRNIDMVREKVINCGGIELYKTPGQISPEIHFEVDEVSNETGAKIFGAVDAFYISKLKSGSTFAKFDFGDGCLNMFDHTIIGVGGITMYDATSPIDMAESDITDVGNITMHDEYSDIDMNGSDITEVNHVDGTTALSCVLDFRGEGSHQIYYTGTSDNRLAYKTYHKHVFSIGANAIMQIASGGIELAGSIKLDGSTGKIKIEENDSTGDMEFTVQSGDAFVFKTVA